jgi:hypothetical protein
MRSRIQEKLRRKSFPLDFQLKFKDISLGGHELVKVIFTSPEGVEKLC